MQFHVITIFPEVCEAYTSASVLGRAQKTEKGKGAKHRGKKIEVQYYDPRDFTIDLPAPRPGAYYVYVILCSNDAMYIGQTNDLQKRWEQHKKGRGGEYTKKHPPKELVHYEVFDSREEAVDREKKLKTGFGRKWIKREYAAGRTRQAGKHRKVDDKPYGGGPGMVMKAEPILRAWEKAVGRKRDQKKVKTLIMSPRGAAFSQARAREYAKKYDHLVLISGRYEGIDARVKRALNAEEVSVGEYILTGGELPALTIIDAVARHIPGVLGELDSLEDDRATTGETYTRPEVIVYRKKKFNVPKVFLSGNHKEIEKQRQPK